MVHKFRAGGLFLALDIFSNGVHILDELSYKLLDFAGEDMPQVCPSIAYEELKEYSKDDIDECYDELLELHKKGILFSNDTYAKIAESMGPAPIKSMCLNVAHDCNLRCEYCFAAKGDFGQGRMLMPLEIGKKAIDFMIEKSMGRHNLELDFFGGEPLMNFDVVKGVVEYARSREKETNKNFRFTITTNGMLLNEENIDYINKEMFNVVLSIDGCKETNDKMRVAPNGTGSYDIIIPKFKKLVEKRGEDKSYYVRGTYTHFNTDFAKDVMHLYDLGFDQISVEPVVCDKELPYALTDADLPLIFNEYDKLANEILTLKKNGSHINFFHFMIDLNGGPCAIKRLRGCSCGNEYVAVTPEGDIYPCHQFVGVEEFKMGNLVDNTFNNEMKKDFSAINVYKKEDCDNCFAKFYCSGVCTANNYQYGGGFFKPHKYSCELQRKRLENSIMIQALLAQN